MIIKKTVKWGEVYVVFITPEAEKIGLNHKSKVTVSLIDDSGKKKIVVEKERNRDMRKP